MRAELKILVLIIYSLASINTLIAQSAISLKVSTLSYNFKDGVNLDNSSLTIGESKKLSFEPILNFEYERFISGLPLSVRFNQGIGIDANGKYSGITQFKMALSVFRQWKSAINVNIGPGIYYRQKWNYPYLSNDYIDISDNLEMSNYYLAFGFEYNYSKNKNYDFSISLNHYNKYNIQLAIGIRYWISKGSKKRYKCSTCPEF